MELGTKAKPREQILALIAALGILVLFMRIFYFPERVAQMGLASKGDNLKLEKEALEKFTQALLKQLPLKKESTLTPQLKILKGEMAPFAKETSLLLTQLTTPQFLRGVAVKKMSDLPPQKKDGFYHSAFLVHSQGPFQNVFNFLGRVERFPALMTIDNITLNSLDSKAAQVELELSGTMYHLGEER